MRNIYLATSLTCALLACATTPAISFAQATQVLKGAEAVNNANDVSNASGRDAGKAIGAFGAAVSLTGAALEKSKGLSNLAPGLSVAGEATAAAGLAGSSAQKAASGDVAGATVDGLQAGLGVALNVNPTTPACVGRGSTCAALAVTAITAASNAVTDRAIANEERKADAQFAAATSDGAIQQRIQDNRDRRPATSAEADGATAALGTEIQRGVSSGGDIPITVDGVDINSSASGSSSGSSEGGIPITIDDSPPPVPAYLERRSAASIDDPDVGSGGSAQSSDSGGSSFVDALTSVVTGIAGVAAGGRYRPPGGAAAVIKRPAGGRTCVSHGSVDNVNGC